MLAMSVAHQSGPRPRVSSCPARIPIPTGDEAPYTDHDALHTTECHDRNSTDLSETNRGRKTKGESEGFGDGSSARLEEECEGTVYAEINDERQEDDGDTVHSPTSSTTWIPDDTANTSLASSPRLDPEDKTCFTTEKEPFEDLANPSPPHKSQQQQPFSSLPSHPSRQTTAPHLSCKAARRDAYLKQSAIRSLKALYSTATYPRPGDIIPPLSRYDRVVPIQGGGYDIVRNGARKPNFARDLALGAVEKAQVAMGLRDPDWDAVQAMYYPRKLKRSFKTPLSFGERCAGGAGWVFWNTGIASLIKLRAEDELNSRERCMMSCVVQPARKLGIVKLLGLEGKVEKWKRGIGRGNVEGGEV